MRCCTCPLLGIKRTCRFALRVSALGPKADIPGGSLLHEIDDVGRAWYRLYFCHGVMRENCLGFIIFHMVPGAT